VSLRVQKKKMKKGVKGKKESEKQKKCENKLESGENQRKAKKHVSFYAKASDVKSAFYTNQPIFVLLYEEACFNTDGDQGTTSKDFIQVPIGPVTRAPSKKFKDVLNGLIQELWAQANSWRPIEHDPRRQQRIVALIQVLEG
jgi:hypothetical protein